MARLALAAVVVLTTFFATTWTASAGVVSDDTVQADINDSISFDVLENDANGAALVEHTEPAHGRLTRGKLGRFSYLPNANFVGSDGFTYRARVGESTLETGTVSIEVTGNVTSVEARNDAISTDEDLPVYIPVLANDGKGPSGLPLQVSIDDGPATGTAEPQADGSILFSPAPDWSGSVELTYSASDGVTSDSAIVAVTVNPVADAPTAADDAVLIRQGGTASIDAFSNDFEADGDSFSLVDFTQPGYGTATWSDIDHMFIYQPSEGVWGVDQFTYSIGDRDGIGTGTITVTINGAPVPLVDAASTSESRPVEINVLWNDSDPEGDTLIVESLGSPSHGSATINSDFTIRYEPDNGFAGNDAFSYTVRDGFGNARESTVNVTVTGGSAATGRAVDDEFLIGEDSPGNSLDLLSNDQVPTDSPISISIDSTPAHGTVTIDALQTPIYVPEPGYSGLDQFTYSIGDSVNPRSSATVTIDIQPVNDLPVADADSAMGAEDTEVVVDVLANDIDEEGEVLAVESATDPANGSVSIGDGKSVVYVPDIDFSGSDSFDYVASDGQGGTATGTVSITITAVNDAPRLGDDRAETAVGESIVVNVLENDSDPDGPQVWLTILAQPAHGSAAVASLNTIAYAPARDYEGYDTFTYQYSDGYEVSTATVTVAVGDVNTAPEVKNDVAETASGEAVEIDLLANDRDADGDDLSTYGITDPNHGTIEVDDDTVTYTPEPGFIGNDEFTYKVSDGNGGRVRAKVKITVNPVQDRRSSDR